VKMRDPKSGYKFCTAKIISHLHSCPLALFSIICLLNKNTKQKNQTRIRQHPRGVVPVQREKTA
jgi:hypothetical protein